MKSLNWKKYLAELLGTMILAIVGLGAIAGHADVLGIAFAFGITLMALVYIIGPISGANVNPAVSLGMALSKKISWLDFLFYVIAQVIGAIIGAFLIFFIVILQTKGSHSGDIFATIGGKTFTGSLPYINTMFIALLIDIAFTFVFVLGILGAIRKVENKAVAGLVIGLLLTALVLTTAALNPAIALGNAIFAGTASLKEVWVYIVGPLVGGALAACVAGLLFKGEDKAEHKEGKAVQPKA